MLSNNQTLKNQYLNQSLLEKQVDLRKSEWWPQLSLRAGYEDIQNRVVYLGENTTTFDRQNSYASLTLSWNLFNGGNRKRAIEIAKVDERAGEITINDMNHSLSNRLYNTYELYEVRKELFKVASESLDAAELNLNISEEKFRAGVINSFNYRDVQLIYQNAAVNRLNTIYNLIEADQALLKLTGGMITEYGETP
jgi:outer membrane protein TolC